MDIVQLQVNIVQINVLKPVSDKGNLWSYDVQYYTQNTHCEILDKIGDFDFNSFALSFRWNLIFYNVLNVIFAWKAVVHIKAEKGIWFDQL